MQEQQVLPEGPRNFITTSQDHGGIALTICTLMATWVVLCFVVRMYMRATVSGPFGLDDIVCSVATVFGVIQMIVSASAISFGFGKALVLLTPEQIGAAEKAVYYIVTDTLTKCTVALLIARIVFIKSRVQACYGVVAASCIWGFASFLAEAIRCTRYAPWTIVGDQCGNLLLSWQVITAFNILIEVALLMFPIWLVWGLRTNLSRKITVVVVFWLRLPVVVAAGLRIHFLAKSIGTSEPLLNAVIPFFCMNIEVHYSLMAATMPTLKPFVGAFNTGWGTYDNHGISGYGGSSGGSYALHSLERKNGKKGSTPVNRSHASGEEGDALRPNYGKNVTHVRSIPTPTRSSGGSEEMIIRQTVTCEVHYEGSEQDAKGSRVTSREGDSIDYVKLY